MAKTVMINADKARNLKFGMNALIELEEMLGVSVTNLDISDFSMKDLRTFFYVGLKWEDKELTQEYAGEVIDSVIENEGMESLSKSLAKSIQLAFGGKSSPPSK